MIRVDTSQLDAFARDMRTLPAQVEAGQAEEARAIAGDVALDASLYPPQPAGSTYVRTYKLERGWGVEANGLEASAINDVSYAAYVMGEGDQASVNAHWRHEGTIAQQWEAQAADRLEQRAIHDTEAGL